MDLHGPVPAPGKRPRCLSVFFSVDIFFPEQSRDKILCLLQKFLKVPPQGPVIPPQLIPTVG